MKKIFIALVSVALLASVLSYVVVPQYAVGLVEEYEPYTFERVLENDMMRMDYGIGNKNDPADYGYPQFEEVSYSSVFDGNELSSWYISSISESQKTIILVHGRWSNRLKTMKYLQLFSDFGIDSLYNVMIPDLRNSGKSEPATTMMGYEFAEDITATIKWLSDEKEQKEVILYGFSMGGMAVPTLTNRTELMGIIKDQGVNITGLILDSPVANVERILNKGGKERNLPGFVLNRTMEILNDSYNDFPSMMKYSILLQDTDIPVLILQGTNDQSQPIEILEDELAILQGKGNINMVSFEDAEHVRIYQDSDHKSRYEEAVTSFLLNL